MRFAPRVCIFSHFSHGLGRYHASIAAQLAHDMLRDVRLELIRRRHHGGRCIPPQCLVTVVGNAISSKAQLLEDAPPFGLGPRTTSFGQR